jgi:hypothetical protein
MSHVLVTGTRGCIDSIFARMLPEAGGPVTAVAQCLLGRPTLPHRVTWFQVAHGLLYEKGV